MNSELKNLLDKIDRIYIQDTDEWTSNEQTQLKGFVSHGMNHYPAAIKLSTKIGGLNSYAAQVILHFCINDKSVATWGCVDSEDTEQLLKWFFDKRNKAVQAYDWDKPNRIWEVS